jgi:hypothetical protein
MKGARVDDGRVADGEPGLLLGTERAPRAPVATACGELSDGSFAVERLPGSRRPVEDDLPLAAQRALDPGEDPGQGGKDW